MTPARRHINTSLLLAGAIATAWLLIHLGCIFLWTWRLETVPIAVAIIMLQTWLSTGLFIIAHDCMHGSLAPGRRRLNTM